MTGADPRMPADPPLARVLKDLEADGYRAQFVAREGAVVRCVAGGHHFSAASSRVDESRRLEGVSDPADSMMVFSLHCPVCDSAGTLVLRYGPDAGSDDAETLIALDPPARMGP